MSPVVFASDAALIELEQAKLFLRISSDDQDDVIQDLINRASDYCEQWTNRRLKARAYTDLRLRSTGSCRLLPPATPIVTSQAIDLSIDGTTLTVWKEESDGNRLDFDVLVVGDADDPRGSPNAFHRAQGWPCRHSDPEPILLSYTGGLVETPGELVDAVGLIVQHLFRMQEKQSTDVNYFASPVAGSLSFAPDLSGSLIPMKAKRILDSYRWIPI